MMIRDMGVREDIAQEAEELFIPFLEKDWTLDFRYFLVEEDNQIIGSFGVRQLVPNRYSPLGKNAYFWNMYIDPDHRRKGFGPALGSHTIELCKQEKIGLIELHASEMGKPLYAVEGFEKLEGNMALFTLKPEPR